MAEQELPLVFVVTSTWRRADVLMQRCIPSVMAQSYPNVEHIIVSDGPDDELLGKLRSFLDESDAPDNLELHFLEEHSKIARHWGGCACNRGLDVPRGELIAYCDDDDALRPRHVELLVAALKANPRAGFAYAQMICHNPSGPVLIGANDPCAGGIGIPMIMHRASLTRDIARWGRPSSFEDWEMIARWLDAGVKWVVVNEQTIDVYYSMFARRSDPWRAAGPSGAALTGPSKN